MNFLMEMATDFFFGAIKGKIKAWLLNLLLDIISELEQLGALFYSTNLVTETLDFTYWLSWVVFGLSFIILLLDIGEELGSYKPGQSIEATTIFTNLIKTIAFMLLAPDLAINGMKLATRTTMYLTVSYDDLRNESSQLMDIALGGIKSIIPIILIIAMIGFFCYTLFCVGGIFIQAATVFLYVPDILRGRTTSMGDWIRQTLAILITFIFRHVLFVVGIVGLMSSDYVTMAIGWVTMFGVSKLLNKFGMSTGFGGVVSHTAQMGQSALHTLQMLGH